MPSIKTQSTIHQKDYWRSLGDLKDSEEFKESVARPFPEELDDIANSFSRRGFLKMMGASMALAGFAGCRRPVENIVPYVKQPEEIIPGIPNYYATTMPLGEEILGLLVESHEGRPTKIEGNRLHPSSLGKAGALHQASILSLYDPDRPHHIQHKNSTKELKDFVAAWQEKFSDLEKSNGAGIAVVSESFSSPSLTVMMNNLLAKFPKAAWVTYEPISNENIYDGISAATGKRYRPTYNFDQAQIIVSLDCDFLMTEMDSVANAHKFATGRRIADRNGSMSRLYTVENSYSATGAMADHRLRMKSTEISEFASALMHKLESLGVKVRGLDGIPKVELSASAEKWLSATAKDLRENTGKSLVVVGRRQPQQVHALVYALNAALGNIGTTVEYTEPKDLKSSDRNGLADLAGKMNAGNINTLVILGGNPAYNAPIDLKFSTGLEKVGLSIHLSDYFNETSELTQWHIPKSHFLESWGDARSVDGTLSIIQPLIAPLYSSQTTLELLHLLTNGKEKSTYELVRDKWRELLGTINFEKKWRQVLHDGVLRESKLTLQAPKINTTSLKKCFSDHPLTNGSKEGRYELAFMGSPAVYDGRFANNGWLQELPDQATKLVWDNAAIMSPNTAKSLGVDLQYYDKLNAESFEMVQLDHGGRTLEMPVFLLPGHADESISVYLGYGRRRCGQVGDGVGFDCYTLRTHNQPDIGVGVKVTKLNKRYNLSTTQHHQSMEGRPLIREAPLDDYKKGGDLKPHLTEIPKFNGKPMGSLWKEPKYEASPQWGMTIDLNACTGCNACIVACQSENNVPVVGKKQAGYGRQMHWIRLDRYFSGDEANPQMIQQPVPCMHCENAPCEQVCPVQATNHDKEGLNVMVYNRCIGTRYCSNNCPYKVRRFNFFNYTKYGPETRIRGKHTVDVQHMSQNPDVTVRSRGVMEKCTYCTQRINQAKIKSKVNEIPLKDGDVTPACEQTCPVSAITFGDITDKDSRVSINKKQERNYVLFQELNIKPRTSYLGKLRNVNPDLVAHAQHVDDDHHH